MSGNLLIVESPNKVKKIKSFLNGHKLSFEVTASCGHIRNLNPKDMSIEIDNNFKPIYINSPDKKKVISQLKSLAKNAKTIWLAMDLDREGEAIAWHIKEVLKLKENQIKRITFTQITKKAILDSIENPSTIDMNMFYSQQARMILDKLIGYKVSPILWKEFGNWKLSAGRVQSVVVKIIQERDEEIKKFKTSNFYKVSSNFNLDNNNDNDNDNNDKTKTNCKTNCKTNNKTKIKKGILKTDLETDIKSREELDNLIKFIPISNKELTKEQKDTKFLIKSIKTSKTKRKPPPPFITSSLQQEASIKLGMSPKSLMMSAQILYESGKITYMRTDSLTLSEDAHSQIKDVITNKFSEKYYNRINYKTKSVSSQEAHEAIRPTKLSVENIELTGKLTSRENKLYKLIWKRTVSSQMKPAEVEITTIKLNLDNSKCNKDYVFNGKFEKLLFDGFLILNNLNNVNNVNNVNNTNKNSLGNEEEEEDDSDDTDDTDKKNKSKFIDDKLLKIIKKIKINDQVYINEVDCLEKYSKPPQSRFTEASLIKKLDELGIGRPSTYASMIDKVQTKGYVEKKTIPPVKKDFINIILKHPNIVENKTKTISVDGEKNKLFVNPLGYMTNTYLNNNFNNILNYKFTSEVELLLDKIAKGEEIWDKVVSKVYNTFNPTVEKLLKSISDKKGSKGSKGSKSNNNSNIINLGNHPDTNIPIIVLNTRYGPAVCLNYEDKSMRKYANFTGNIEDMKLEKAIKLLQYPKLIGKYKEHEIYLNKRSNFYLSYNKKNYSIDNYNKAHSDNGNLINPKNITLQESIDVIKYFNIITYFF